MKKHISLVILLFFFLPLVLTGQRRYELDNGRAVILYRGDTTIKCKVLISSVDIKLKTDLSYFWFNTGEIKVNQGGYSGSLLHGMYKEFDKDDNLIREGDFTYGLKTGKWKQWNSKGELTLIQTYKNGNLNGEEVKYDNCRVVRVTKYKKGLKHGKELIYINDKEVITKRYRKGKLVDNGGLIKSIFSKNRKKENFETKESKAINE